MRKVESLKYEPAPAKDGKCEITARLVSIKEEPHLLIDYFRDRQHTGRTVFTENNYSTYDYEECRWSQATRYYLRIGGYEELDAYSHTILSEYEELIKGFYHKEGYSIEDNIGGYMWKIQERREREKQEKKTKIMEEHLAKVGELPEEYINTCKENIKKQGTAIWYKRNGRYTRYICGACSEEWQRNHTGEEYIEYINRAPVPKPGMKVICPYCKQEGKLGQLGRAKRIYQHQEYGLFEILEDKTVVYRNISMTRQQYPEEKEQFSYREALRIFFDKDNKVHIYEHGYNFYYGEFWKERKKAYIAEKVIIIGDWQKVFKKSEPLKYFQKGMISENVVNCAMAFVKIPQFEMCHKMGLTSLCKSFEYAQGDVGRSVNKKARTIEDFLKVRKFHVKEIIKEKGNRSLIDLYRAEKTMNLQWNEKEWELVRKLDVYNAHGIETMRDIGTYTSIQKAYNYILKQKGGAYGNYILSIRSHYADYLNMRAALGYDMTNTVYLFPHNLKEQHDAMVLEKEIRENEKYIKEMLKKYPKIAKRAQTLDKKWGYQEGKFMIRAAASAEEIVLEGRTQHHCVGGERQGYMRKHNDGESYIFLMRRIDEPEKPYVTLELANGKVRQWYGKNDRKNVEGELDEKEVDAWLDRWLKIKGKKIAIAV